MNASKNAVLKYSSFTSGLTRALKSNSARLHCNVDANGMIYVCNGYFVVKLDKSEYNALVRPVTQRDAGNWALIDNGEISPDPINLIDALNDAAKLAAHVVTPAPMLFEIPKIKGKFQLAGYYSETGDFVTAFNPVYASIVSPSLERKSGGSVKPTVVYDGESPIAMILPVKVDDKPNIVRTVRAWFTDKPEESADEKLQRARKDRNEWERIARRLEAERDSLERELAELQAVLASKNQQIEILTERLNAQPDPQPAPVEEAQPDQTPADKAAALVEELTALEGITATVKGAQTAAPVVWLTGEADAHKKNIEAMGGKWSNKRGAWYFKIA